MGRKRKTPEQPVDDVQNQTARFTPTTAFGSEFDNIVAELEMREVSRVEKSSWYDRFLYISEGDCYFDKVSRREISRSAFNASFKHVMCSSIHTRKKIEPSSCYDENRDAHNVPILFSLTYAPGADVVISREGDLFGNRWVDARPTVDTSIQSDVSLWLNHCIDMVPNEEERNHILDTMAFKLQFPEIKINHAILHGGDEGCGKDTMWAPFIWSVCGPNLRNRGLMDSESISSQWGYALESEIVIINELKEPSSWERRQFANKLKPIIATPPDMLPINRKGLHPYQMINRIFVLAFSNDPLPMSLASQDRRWFAVWTNAPRMTPEKAKEIWGWYNDGGLEAIASWLYNRDVSGYNPKAAPKETEFKISMIEHGMTSSEAFIVDMIRERSEEFALGIVGSPFNPIVERLAVFAPHGTKITQSTLLHGFKEGGWKDCGWVKSSEYPSKKHVFGHPDVVENKSKSELRKMVERRVSCQIKMMKK